MVLASEKLAEPSTSIPEKNLWWPVLLTILKRHEPISRYSLEASLIRLKKNPSIRKVFELGERGSEQVQSLYDLFLVHILALKPDALSRFFIFAVEKRLDPLAEVILKLKGALLEKDSIRLASSVAVNPSRKLLSLLTERFPHHLPPAGQHPAHSAVSMLDVDDGVSALDVDTDADVASSAAASVRTSNHGDEA